MSAPRRFPGPSFPAAALVGGLCAALAGCEEPPVDPVPRADGGTGFGPVGVLGGTVQYSGPRVPCAIDPDTGEPTRILGRVVLTLFRAANPPPPEGTAEGPENLLFVPGSALFQVPGDCAGGDGSMDPSAAPLLRSAPFLWPEIPLGEGGPVAYQVRGFYDGEGDFVPFFSELSQPTAGDQAGGLVGPDGRFQPVTFGARRDHPEGQRIDGLSVNLGAVVRTERPVFRIHPESGQLPSEALFPATPDPGAFEEALFRLAELRLSLVGEEDASFLAQAAAIGLDFGVASDLHAWFLRTVDLDGDGTGDPHPVLEGFPWATPLLFFRRLPGSPGELAAGVPPVTLLGSIRPSLLAQGRRVAAPDLDVLLAPVALVDLDPSRPECRVPYVPPGNLKEAYDGGARACQELPTGRYAVTALQGILGGGPLMDVPPGVSDTGRDLPGERLSTQSWTVPNLLDGLPAGPGIPRPDSVLLVHDPNPEDGVGQDAPGCTTAVSAVTGSPAPVALEDPPAGCCTDRIRGLCDLPLCPPVLLASRGRSELAVREPDPGGGSGTLSCTPFQPPRACCR